MTGAHPNFRSVGIELQQPEKAGPAIFTDEQYAALIELVGQVAARQAIPLDREHLLGHYDVSPLRRSTKKGGWDPGEAFDWARLLAAFQNVS